MLSFKRFKIVFTKHFGWVGLLQPLEESFYQLPVFQKFFQWAIYLVFEMQYRINGSN